MTDIFSKININKSAKYYLLLFFITGLIIRSLFLSSIPNGLFRDEASKGMIAYSILETGTDLDGRPYPLFTRELSTYNTAVYSYLTIPFIKIFGLNEFSVRFPAALAGSLAILALYWGLLPYLKRQYALSAAFLLTFLPWHLIFSRWANQGILVPLLLCLAIGFLGRSSLSCLENPNHISPFLPNENANRIATFIILSLSLYAYDINKAFIPLFFIVILLAFWKSIRENIRQWVLSFTIFILVSLPIILYTLANSNQSQSRFNRISILGQQYNLPELIFVFVRNWLSHFSPSYLFTSGDANLRHQLPFTGILLLAMAPLLIAGILRAYNLRKTPIGILTIGWMLIYPVPASLTIEGIPHALRSITGIPVICILSAMGVEQIYSWYCSYQIKLKKLLVSSLAIFTVLNIILVLSSLFVSYPLTAASAFQYGMKETVQSVNKVQNQYSLILVSPSLQWPEVFFEFYAPEKRKSTSTSNLRYFNDSIELNSYLQNLAPGGKALLVVSGQELNDVTPLKTINYPDGTVAVRLIEYPQ